MVLYWPDLRSISHAISWEVTPLIRAFPAAVVILPSDHEIERLITLVSESEPFRITGVTGPFETEGFDPPLKTKAARRHTFRLRIDPKRMTARRAADLEIATELPAQPVVKVSVALIPS